MKPTITEALANQIYNVLVEECGVYKGLRPEFIYHTNTHGNRVEFRFGGSLGFGGKLYYNGGGLYVACYPEDKTPSRDLVIEKANEALTAILIAQPNAAPGDE